MDQSSLSAAWRENLEETQRLGDAWLTETRSALLRVPSAPSPESQNYLFNPRHPDAKSLTMDWCKWINWDKRLFHLSELTPPESASHH